jgi:hypothetical protein
MSRFDDFFEEAPPAGHADRVMRAAMPELERLQKVAKALGRRKIFWGFLTVSVASAAGLLLWNRQTALEEQEMTVAAFDEVDSSADVDMLAEADADLFDLLQALDDKDLEEES